MARLAGLEPAASASAGLRSIRLSYKRFFQLKPPITYFSLKGGGPLRELPKEGFEPSRPKGHYALNVARLPFRHFGALPHFVYN